MGIGVGPSARHGVEPQASSTSAAINDNITFLFINFLLLLQWILTFWELRPSERRALFSEKDSGFPRRERRRVNLEGFLEQNPNQFNSLACP
jgi:hypothetical protein